MNESKHWKFIEYCFNKYDKDPISVFLNLSQKLGRADMKKQEAYIVNELKEFLEDFNTFSKHY